MSRRRALAVTAAICAALVACTGPVAPEPSAPVTSPAAPVGPGPTEVVATRTFPAKGVDVEVDVHPLVRVDDHVVLTLDLSAPGVADPVDATFGFGATAPLGGLLAPGGVRLVDLRNDVLHAPAEDADGRIVTNYRRSHTFGRVSDSVSRWQLVYAAPPADVPDLGLLLPGAAFLPDLPVIDADVPPPAPDGGPTSPTPASPSATSSPTASDDTYREVTTAAVSDARTVPLESYTRELAGAVSTLQRTEEVSIALGSDVLFAIDSADLSPEAAAALDASAAHLRSREPGTVSVVGHTDDVADDAYNQQLSERRAQAVAAALAERIDVTDYPLEVSGRGESEPVVPNDSAEHRATNRRVTLTLTTQVATEPEVSTAGQLPPFEDGPVATGTEGVTLGSDASVRLVAADARLVHGHLVVDLQVTAQQDDVFPPSVSGVYEYRQDAFRAQGAIDRVVTLLGSTAVFPMDYRWASTEDEEYTLWLPAASLNQGDALRVGQTRTWTVLYPEIGDPESVTLQVSRSLGAHAFRLTDVAVRSR